MKQKNCHGWKDADRGCQRIKFGNVFSSWKKMKKTKLSQAVSESFSKLKGVEQSKNTKKTWLTFQTMPNDLRIVRSQEYLKINICMAHNDKASVNYFQCPFPPLSSFWWQDSKEVKLFSCPYLGVHFTFRSGNFLFFLTCE